jgi:RimJ/RimL family protein N-acetyltransferase
VSSRRDHPRGWEVHTPRLLLRAIGDRDIDAFAAMNADPRVMEHLPACLSRDESEQLIETIRANVAENGFGPWAVEIPGRASFIGIVGFHRATFEAPFTPCIEIAWRLAADHWGQGYATEAARAALQFAFEHLAADEILAWTVPQNGASRRVMEKLGMTHDPADDFDHPRLPEGHRLRRHVVYRIDRATWGASRAPAGS